MDKSNHFKIHSIIFRIQPVIFKTNPVKFRTNPVIFRTHPVIFRKNPVLFQSNTFIFSTYIVIFRTYPLIIIVQLQNNFPTKIIFSKYVCDPNWTTLKKNLEILLRNVRFYTTKPWEGYHQSMYTSIDHYVSKGA